MSFGTPLYHLLLGRQYWNKLKKLKHLLKVSVYSLSGMLKSREAVWVHEIRLIICTISVNHKRLTVNESRASSIPHDHHQRAIPKRRRLFTSEEHFNRLITTQVANRLQQERCPRTSMIIFENRYTAPCALA